jgi:hypothetical protein
VHAPCLAIDERGQRVDVRALQLGERTPLQDLARDLVSERELLENLERG